MEDEVLDYEYELEAWDNLQASPAHSSSGSEFYERLQLSPLHPSTKDLFPNPPVRNPVEKWIPETQPLNINGGRLSDLATLRPSTSIAEMKMRIDNDIQKFITREEEIIYIPKRVLQRLDLDKLMQIKARSFRINLPERREVTLRVYSNGNIMMYNHKKRTEKKFKKEKKSN